MQCELPGNWQLATGTALLKKHMLRGVFRLESKIVPKSPVGPPAQLLVAAQPAKQRADSLALACASRHSPAVVFDLALSWKK